MSTGHKIVGIALRLVDLVPSGATLDVLHAPQISKHASEGRCGRCLDQIDAKRTILSVTSIHKHIHTLVPFPRRDTSYSRARFLHHGPSALEALLCLLSFDIRYASPALLFQVIGDRHALLMVPAWVTPVLTPKLHSPGSCVGRPSAQHLQ